MRNTIKGIIFDLDGTLLNTLDDLADSVNYVLSKNDMPSRTINEIRSFVGNGVAKLIERAVVNGTSKEQCEKMLEEFKIYYKDHNLDKTAPYDGILDMLKSIKAAGIRMAVVSNKLDAATKSLCKHFFGDYIEYAIGDNEYMSKKPDPDMVYEALKQLDITNEEAVYVGDSEVDIKTAENARMKVIMVEWGFRDRADMEALGAECFIRRPKEILEKL